MKSKICASCGGTLVAKEIRYDQHWGDDIVVFENVKAQVCPHCDEIWLDAKVVKKIDRILTQQEKPTYKMSVPVWNLKTA